MAAPRVRKEDTLKDFLEEPASEEMQKVALFRGMLKMIEEMYVASLNAESGDELQSLLGDVGMVKVKIEMIIDRLMQDEEMRKAQLALEEGGNG